MLIFSACSSKVDTTWTDFVPDGARPREGRYERFFENEHRVDGFDFFVFTQISDTDWRWARGGGSSNEAIGGRIKNLVNGHGFALIQEVEMFMGTEPVFGSSLFADLEEHPQIMIEENGEQKIYVHKDALITIEFKDATFDGAHAIRYIRKNTQLLPGNTWYNPIPDFREGHIFKGWFTINEAGELIAYAFGTRVTNNLELIARWEQQVIVNFDLQGGNGNSQQMIIPINSSIEDLRTPTRQNYVFVGWYDNADFDGVPYTTESIINRAITLFAKWQIKSNDLMFNGNGATVGSVDSIKNVQGGSSITLPSNEYMRLGYDFVGWCFNPNGEGNIYAASSLYSMPLGESAITLYAHWLAQTYTITYHDVGELSFSGVHGAEYPMRHTFGVATYLIKPTKTSFFFEGWFSNSAGIGLAITHLSATDFSADIMLFAKWREAQDISVLISDYFFNSEFNITIKEGESLTRPINPARAGKVFGGYFCDAKKLQPFDFNIPLTESITIYVKWTLPLYKYPFDDYFDWDSVAIEKARLHIGLIGSYIRSKSSKANEAIVALAEIYMNGLGSFGYSAHYDVSDFFVDNIDVLIELYKIGVTEALYGIAIAGMSTTNAVSDCPKALIFVANHKTEVLQLAKAGNDAALYMAMFMVTYFEENSLDYVIQFIDEISPNSISLSQSCYVGVVTYYMFEIFIGLAIGGEVNGLGYIFALCDIRNTTAFSAIFALMDDYAGAPFLQPAVVAIDRYLFQNYDMCKEIFQDNDLSSREIFDHFEARDSLGMLGIV